MKTKIEKHLHSEDILCIFGQPQVGKTTLVKEIFKDNPDLTHVYLSCDDLTSASDLYIKIIKELYRKLPKNEKRKQLCKIMKVEDFCDELSEITHGISSKIFVILDNIKLWKKTFIIDCILILQELSKFLTLVLISSESILDTIGHLSYVTARARIQDKALEIELPIWTKTKIIDVILQTQPKRHAALYEMFVKNAVAIIYADRTKNFVSIKNFCQAQFPVFIERYIKEGSNDAHLDEYCARHPTEVQTLIRKFLAPVDREEPMEWMKRDQKITISMGLLIVAIFVAAYTSTSDDKRNFVRYQKRSKTRKITNHIEEEDPASRTFTLERIIQIYAGLGEISNPKDPTDDEAGGLTRNDIPDSVLSDLRFLQDLKMVHIFTGDGLDSSTRFKISNHITRDYVERIAQQVGLSLDQIYGLY